MPDPPRVFISYKHKVEPDQSVVDQVVEALEPHHTVFIDKKTLPGLEWGKWIQERIAESDLPIVFLTAPSARSEKAELQTRNSKLGGDTQCPTTVGKITPDTIAKA
jgi:TIR domain